MDCERGRESDDVQGQIWTGGEAIMRNVSRLDLPVLEVHHRRLGRRTFGSG